MKAVAQRKQADGEWHQYLWHCEAKQTIPSASPRALVVTPGTAGTSLADWADARRAAWSRVWVQVVGVDADFRAVATMTVSDATLTGLPSGKPVNVRVTAVNGAAESALGAEAEIAGT